MDSMPQPAPSDLRQRTRRGPRVLIAAVLILALPAIALASHQFSDVPTTSPFHSNISRLVDSGITAGCATGKFCPQAGVTREQMAAFMSRGLGRTALGSGVVSFAEAAGFYSATVTITTGGATGGTGFVTLAASLEAVADVPALCPCRGTAFLVDLATTDISDTRLLVVSDTGFGDDIWGGTTPLNWVFPAPTNRSRTYGLAVDIETTGVIPGSTQGGAPGTNAWLFGTLTAEYSPFGSAGGATLGTTGAGGFTFGDPEPNHRKVAPER